MKALLLVAILSSVVAGTLHHFDRSAARVASQAQPADSAALTMPLLVPSPAWPVQPDPATVAPR